MNIPCWLEFFRTESRWLERAHEVASRFEAQQAALRSAPPTSYKAATLSSAAKEKDSQKGNTMKSKKGGKQQDQSNPWWSGRKGIAVEQTDIQADPR